MNKDIERMLILGRHQFGYGELMDDAIDRGVVVGFAMTLILRKYPKLGRLRFVYTLCRAWLELKAFISYERGKFYTEFVRDVAIKGGIIKNAL